MIRKPTTENPPKIGEWVLPSSILKDGIVMAPRLIVAVSDQTVRVTDPRERDSEPRRFSISSIAYVTPSFREADRAHQMSERLRRRLDDERKAVVADIEAINEEPVA